MSTVVTLGPVGLKPTGAYNNTREYKKLDVVIYQGSSYVAKSDSIGQLPTNTTYWNCIAEKGDTGTDGQDGHTPVKGTDYWTTQDKQEIVTDVETDLQPTISTIQNTAYTAERIALGANQSLSFSNYQAMITAFNSLANNVYNVGQNVMIITLNVPDLWISSIESTSSAYTYTTDEAFTTELATNGYVQVGYYRLSALETQKVDLTNYYTKSQADTLLGSKVDESSFVYDSNTETLSITIS